MKWNRMEEKFRIYYTCSKIRLTKNVFPLTLALTLTLTLSYSNPNLNPNPNPNPNPSPKTQ